MLRAKGRLWREAVERDARPSVGSWVRTGRGVRGSRSPILPRSRHAYVSRRRSRLHQNEQVRTGGDQRENDYS